MALDPAIAWVLRAVLALILLGAARHKWRERARFGAALADYRLLPAFAVQSAAFALPILELGTGVALLSPLGGKAALAAAALFGTYAAAIAINLARGRTFIDCGCGGREQPLSFALLARNALLVAAALAASGAPVARSLGPLDGVTLVAGTATLLALYAARERALALAPMLAAFGRGAEVP